MLHDLGLKTLYLETYRLLFALFTLLVPSNEASYDPTPEVRATLCKIPLPFFVSTFKDKSKLKDLIYLNNYKISFLT